MFKRLIWICFCCCLSFDASYSQVWSALKGKPDDDCYVLALDSTEKNLLIGGSFTFIDSDSMNGIASYKFDNFQPLDYGIPYQSTRDFAYFEGKLIAAGTGNQLFPIMNIGQWDGLNWNKIPISGTNLQGISIHSLEVFQNELYASGDIYIPGIGLQNIARFDGSSWKNVEGGVGSGGRFPLDMIVYRNELVVAGLFDSTGSIKVKNIAVWDGISWKSISKNEIQEQINTVEIFNDTLYAGTLSSKVYMLNDSSWTLFATAQGGFEFITKLKSTTLGLVVGGDFDSINEIQASNVALWDGTKWNPMGTGTNGRILGIQEYNNQIAVCGKFSMAGGLVAHKLAIWGSPLGVESQLNQSEISVYPIPATNFIYISFHDKMTEGTLQIVNSCGQLLLAKEINISEKYRLNLDLDTGMYFIRFITDKGIYHSKLIIE